MLRDLRCLTQTPAAISPPPTAAPPAKRRGPHSPPEAPPHQRCQVSICNCFQWRKHIPRLMNQAVMLSAQGSISISSTCAFFAVVERLEVSADNILHDQCMSCLSNNMDQLVVPSLMANNFFRHHQWHSCSFDCERNRWWRGQRQSRHCQCMRIVSQGG